MLIHKTTAIGLSWSASLAVRSFDPIDPRRLRLLVRAIRQALGIT